MYQNATQTCGTSTLRKFIAFSSATRCHRQHAPADVFLYSRISSSCKIKLNEIVSTACSAETLDWTEQKILAIIFPLLETSAFRDNHHAKMNLDNLSIQQQFVISDAYKFFMHVRIAWIFWTKTYYSCDARSALLKLNCLIGVIDDDTKSMVDFCLGRDT